MLSLSRAPAASALVVVLALGALVGACASGGTATIDAGGRAYDAGPGDASRPVDMRVGCASGQHVCPSGCTADRTDDPANGCRLGCGSAPCTAPAGGTASCSTGGMCDFECAPPFVREGEGCACTPRTCSDLDALCGSPDDGCGTPLACGDCGSGSACTSGRCVCAPDPGEPNDTESAAIRLGATNDADNGPTLTETIYNSDDALDLDYFFVDVTDGTDGGNPVLTVTLDGMPAGSNLDLVAWYRCTAGGDSHTCTIGSNYSGAGGAGCSSVNPGTSTETVAIDTECSTTDDSGRLVVRVGTSGFGMCGNYHLVIETR